MPSAKNTLFISIIRKAIVNINNITNNDIFLILNFSKNKNEDKNKNTNTKKDKNGILKKILLKKLKKNIQISYQIRFYS